MAGLDPTETGNELSLPTSEFTTLTMHVQHTLREGEAPAIRQRHYQSVGLLFSSPTLQYPFSNRYCTSALSNEEY